MGSTAGFAGSRWVAGGVLVVGAVVPVVGAWNPWNLVVVDRVLFHPILGGLVVAGAVCWIGHLSVRQEWLRVLGMAAAIGAASLWTLAWLMLSSLRHTDSTMVVASPFNDVEVELRNDEMASTASVWLRADRGLLSRENEVGLVGTDRSGAPGLDARFTAPDEIVVTTGGQTVYRLTFDPGDLDAEDEECATVSSEERGTVTSCVSPADEGGDSAPVDEDVRARHR